jgi:hypothetical protein
MRTNKVTLSLFFAATLVAASAFSFAACSSSDNGQPGPSPHEGGADVTPTGDDGGGGDTSTPDTAAPGANCSDAAPDPYNLCSPYVTNCIPFTRSVPQHPQL